MHRLCVLGVVLALCSSTALAAPLFPEIIDHKFLFGAEGTYYYNGVEPDVLYIPRSDPVGIGGGEVLGYKAAGGSWQAIYDVSPGIGFGGDLALNLEFYSSDGAFIDPNTGNAVNVSLIGRGDPTNSPDPGQDPNTQVYDLEIWGSLDGDPNSEGLLMAMEIEVASLYGIAGQRSYVVEATGDILYSDLDWLAAEIAANDGRLAGGVTGSIFWPVFPTLYSPLENRQGYEVLSYDGVAGMIPEPASCVLVFLGGLGVILRRRRR